MTAVDKKDQPEVAAEKEALPKAPKKRGRPKKAATSNKLAAGKLTPTERAKKLEGELEATREQFGRFIAQAEEKNNALISELMTARKQLELKDKSVLDLIGQNTSLEQELYNAHQQLAKHQTTGTEG